MVDFDVELALREAGTELQGWNPVGDINAVVQRSSRRPKRRSFVGVAAAAVVATLLSVGAALAALGGSDGQIDIADTDSTTVTHDSPVLCQVDDEVAAGMDPADLAASFDAAIQLSVGADAQKLAELADSVMSSGAPLARAGHVELAVGDEPEIWHHSVDEFLASVPAGWQCQVFGAIEGEGTPGLAELYNVGSLDPPDSLSCLESRDRSASFGLDDHIRDALNRREDVLYWAISVSNIDVDSQLSTFTFRASPSSGFFDELMALGSCDGIMNEVGS